MSRCRSLFESAVQDLSFALRQFVRNPAFSISVLLILSLGIGSTVAVFTVVDGILFRPLPYAAPGRLVAYGILAPIDAREFLFGFDYLRWRVRVPAFEAVTSMFPGERACDLTEPNPQRLSCVDVESTFLPLFGVRPLLGRNFTRAEDQPGAPGVVLLSYPFWRSRFGGQPGVLGRSLSLDGQPARIIGVLPESFEMPNLARFDLLAPQRLNEAAQRPPNTGALLRTFARLRPGWTPAQAAAVLHPMLERTLQEAPPAFRHEIRIGVRDLREWQSGDRRRTSWVLLFSVLAVLLLACMNVATLLLARAVSRERELAMREALGAGRGRLVRQTLTESLLLGCIAGVCGMAAAFGLLRAVVKAAPESIPGLASVHLDARAAFIALLLAVVNGLLFGILPALRLPGVELLAGWRSTSPARTRIRGLLVTAQIAGSLVMMTAAGLMLRTLWRLESLPLGIDAAHVVTAELTLGSRYDGLRTIAFSEQLERALRAQPGISTVAVSDTLPPSGRTRSMPFFVLRAAGRPPFEHGVGGMIPWRAVSSGYFQALGIPMLRGRGFTDADAGSREQFIVLSDALARRLFRSDDPLGARMTVDGDHWFTVIGIAAGVRNRGLASPPDPEFYLDRDQRPEVAIHGPTSRHVAVVVRSVLDRRFLAPLLRERIHELDPTVPVDTAGFDDRLAELTTGQRFHAALFSAFAGIALLLAISGLYGLVAFLVAQRRQEIGVRIALGASPADVAAMVVRYALRFTLAGVAGGVIGAVLITRWMESMLYGVSARDPLTLVVVAAVLLCSAVAAALAPSLSAARTDPMIALRAE